MKFQINSSEISVMIFSREGIFGFSRTRDKLGTLACMYHVFLTFYTVLHFPAFCAYIKVHNMAPIVYINQKKKNLMLYIHSVKYLPPVLLICYYSYVVFGLREIKVFVYMSLFSCMTFETLNSR